MRTESEKIYDEIVKDLTEQGINEDDFRKALESVDYRINMETDLDQHDAIEDSLEATYKLMQYAEETTGESFQGILDGYNTTDPDALGDEVCQMFVDICNAHEGEEAYDYFCGTVMYSDIVDYLAEDGDSEEDLNENLSNGQGNARRLMEGLYGVDEYYSDEVKFLLEPRNRQLLDEGDFDALFKNACNKGCAVGLGVILVKLGICERDDIYQYMPGSEDLREYDGRCLVDLLDWQDLGKSGKHEYYYIFYYGDVDTDCSRVGPLHADTDEDLAKALIAYFALEDNGNGIDDVVKVIGALSKGKKIGTYWKYVSEGSLHTSNNFGYVIKEDGKIIEDCVMWEEEVGPDEYEDVYGEGAAKTSGLDFYEWGDYWADDDDEDDDEDEDLDESLRTPLKESLTDELNKLRKVLESNGFTFVESQPDRKQVIFKDSSGNEFCAQLAETTLKLKSKSILVKVDKSEVQEDKPVYQYKTMPGVALSKEYVADGAKAAQFINDLLKSN